MTGLLFGTAQLALYLKYWRLERSLARDDEQKAGLLAGAHGPSDSGLSAGSHEFEGETYGALAANTGF